MEEARKVQITGKSTYMITLPKKWAVDVGLQPGSLVSLSYRGEGSLLLTPSTSKPVISHKILEINGEKNGLRRDIIGAYVMGHQFIELHARTIPQEIRKVIKGLCKDLIGSEIVEETKDKIVIYDILDPGECDHAVKIANTLSSIGSDDDLPRDITDKIAGVGKNSRDSVEKSIISLRRVDVALAGTVLRENAKIRQNISEIKQLKIATPKALPIGIITDSISRIGDYAGNIAELAIDLHQL